MYPNCGIVIVKCFFTVNTC